MHSGRRPRAPRFRATGRFAKLHGKTALIVGRGAIRRMLAQAFGLQILTYSPRVARINVAEAVATLAEGLTRTEPVSRLTPLREEAGILIGANALAAMRPDAGLPVPCWRMRVRWQRSSGQGGLAARALMSVWQRRRAA